MKDDLGDRMKDYERLRTSDRLKEESPFVYCRIDGRGFSKFTKGMQKPFDNELKDLMVSVTKALVHKTHAIAGYTQSDEISLAWDRKGIFFDGKIQKLTSILSAMATSHFIIEGLATNHYSRIVERYPHFDARVFELPDEDEVANAFLWRYNDCRRNAIQSIGQAKFSHKELHKKSIKDLEFMLASIGIFKEDFPKDCIEGTFLRRVDVEIETFSGLINRTEIEQISVPFREIGHESRKSIILNGTQNGNRA